MYRLFLFFLVCLIFLTSCEQEIPVEIPELATVTPGPVVLRLGVTSSAAPFVSLVDGVARPGSELARTQFVLGTTATLFEDLDSGQLDGIFVHDLPADFAGYFTPVALDGLVVMVAPGNPIEALSLAQLRALFSGQISNWSAVTPVDIGVAQLSRERGSGNRDIFLQRVMVELPITINALVPPTYEALLAELEQTPGGVAFGAMGHVGSNKVVALDGVVPTVATVSDQSYPLTMPLYFVSLMEPAGSPATSNATSAELRAFVAWLQSADGQSRLATRYGRVLPP